MVPCFLPTTGETAIEQAGKIGTGSGDAAAGEARSPLARLRVLTAVACALICLVVLWWEPFWHEVFGVGGLAGLLAALWGLNSHQHRLARRELEARVQERTRELNRVNARLMDAERIAHLGHWERDLVTGAGFWSDETFRIYGLPREPESPPQERFLACIHPDDRTALVRMRAAVILEKVPYELRYRVVRPDGAIRHVYSEAEVVRDAEGRALRLIGTTLDITALVEAEERLKEAERIAHLGHWEWRALTDSYFWSEELYRILGVAPSEVQPGWMALLERIHEGDRLAVAGLPLSLQWSSEAGSVEARIVRPDGSSRRVRITLRVSLDAAGGVSGMFGTALDVSDRHAAQLALSESHAALMSIINATEHDMVGLIDADGTIRVANNCTAKVLKRPLAGIVGRKLVDFSPADDRGFHQAVLDEVLSRGATVHFESVWGDLAFDAHYAPALGPDGGTIGIAVFARDITARKRVETNLRKLTRAIEQAPLSVVITDTEGFIEYVNPHFTKATGYPAGEVVGRSSRILKSGYTSREDYEAMWRTIAAGEVWHGEFHNKRRDGRLIWERASIAPVRDEKGTVTHYVAVKEDVTERKRAEVELLAAKERAEAASTAKSQFMATISHELRTPLNAIIGFSEVMRDGAFGPLGDERYQRFARSINEAGAHLLKLINDIIDLANAEAGHFAMAETIVDPRAEVLAAIEAVKEAAAAASLLLVIDVPEHLPLLYADERAIRQIAGNLLDNAVKFTPSGGRITVRAALEESGLFAITVSDTGIGIPHEKLSTVLQPFEQLDGTLSREHEGTGLGLPLSRTMAEMHGGHLEIESAVKAGTIVTVRFPRDRVLMPGQELAALAPGLTG